MAALPETTTIEACWKRIGIQGDKSCPELEAFSHCRNCPVFSRGAAQLLDRAVDGPPQPLALPALPPETREASESLMIFRLGAEWFALPTLALDEIVGPRPVHSLPHRRDAALLGLVNVRGELVVCVSVARVLLGVSAEGASGWMIVARHDSGRLAFPVDEVAQTIHHAPDALQPVPATLAHASARFTRGVLSWRGTAVGRLDEGALFEALSRCLA